MSLDVRRAGISRSEEQRLQKSGMKSGEEGRYVRKICIKPGAEDKDLRMTANLLKPGEEGTIVNLCEGRWRAWMTVNLCEAQ